MAQRQNRKKVLGIRELRGLFGLNQEELAEASGITKGHLANIESHARIFTYSTAEKIAEAMNNMLERAKEIGDLEKEADSKVEQLGNKWKNRAVAEENDGAVEQIYASIAPEHLIASNSASTYPSDLQDKAYELLIDIEKIQHQLQYLKSEREDFSKEFKEALDERFKHSPADIIQVFLADKHYAQALWGLIEEFRNHLNRRRGYFLSN